MDILKQLQIELGIKASQVENTVKLLDEGNTVPFIARYRKEVTGSLDDQIIRQLAERLTALRNLEEKREMVRNAITEQGAMTDELSAKLEAAMTPDRNRGYLPSLPSQTPHPCIHCQGKRSCTSGGIHFRTGISGAAGRIRRRFCRCGKRRGICGGCHQRRKRYSGRTVL